MIQEESVTLETAKLLKEKGFNERKYLIDVSTLNHCYKYLSVPPQSVAQKWLREIRGVYVYVEPVIGKRWKISFCDFNVPTEESDWMENEINKGNGYKVYVTYEEALEAGLQEALKLI